MIFGLSIGLSVAFAIYKKDLAAVVATQTSTPEPASMTSTLAEGPPADDSANEVTPPGRFTFYEDLPTFEVIIHEEEPDVSRDRTVAVVQEPGVYVLQAGSFGALQDADRRRAQLALLGIESRVQRVAIDSKIYHRVRIGPIGDLEKLNLIRNQLRRENIDVLRIRLGD